MAVACAGVFQFTPLREGRRTQKAAGGAHEDFNSRPSARGDKPGSLTMVPSPYFNSRPSARGDLCFHHILCTTFDFNSRPSARGDCYPFADGVQHGISIHAPPRGATILAYPKSDFQEFQFTPLREGRRGIGTRRKDYERISIHAPPRGATARARNSPYIRHISIHAPPRGATLMWRQLKIVATFQFTPLREGRRSSL